MVLESGGGAPARLQSVGEDAAMLSSVEGDDAPTITSGKCKRESNVTVTRSNTTRNDACTKWQE